MKHSGAAMSSRLMPPKVGAIAATVSMNASIVGALTSMSNTSMPAKRLNSTALALEHRLGGQRAAVAESEDRGAVADDRDEVALVGVAVGHFRIAGDLAHRFGHARAVGER